MYEGKLSLRESKCILEKEIFPVFLYRGDIFWYDCIAYWMIYVVLMEYLTHSTIFYFLFFAHSVFMITENNTSMQNINDRNVAYFILGKSNQFSINFHVFFFCRHCNPFLVPFSVQLVDSNINPEWMSQTHFNYLRCFTLEMCLVYC